MSHGADNQVDSEMFQSSLGKPSSESEQSGQAERKLGLHIACRWLQRLA